MHVAQVCLLFKQYKNYLRTEMGTMTKFRMSYIDLVKIMHDLINGSREGNWRLHLAAVKYLIAWCFAYNRTKYARCLFWYL